jgi:enoyl-CoA hydratase/carnithine racemase
VRRSDNREGVTGISKEESMSEEMPRPFSYTPLQEYAPKFTRIKFDRADGILTITLHKDGGEFSWNLETHRELSHVWNYVGLDPENKVIILTGTGNSFLDRSDYEIDQMAAATPQWWLLVQQDAKKLLTDFLEIEQPVIVALNGPVAIHSQIPMLGDIILATPDASITETHFPYAVPGDGHHIVWPLILGLNRAKYLLLTQRGLTAQQALEIGLVSEIVERDRLLKRAEETARQLLEMDPVALRAFRPIVMQPVKRAVLDGLSQGLLAEGYEIIRKLTDAEPVGQDPRTSQ